MSVTDQNPESAPKPALPQRRPAAGDGDNAASPGLPQRRPAAGNGEDAASPGLPQRFPGAPEQNGGPGLPRRASGGRPSRVGRHRSLHRISVASDAPALVLAVPGWADAAADLAGRIAEAAIDSCPGVDIRVGFLSGSTDTLAGALAADAESRSQHGPQAVVVPLLAGPHPVHDAAIAAAISAAKAPVMLATALGPHPLLAGALHDRLHEVGLARASRARGLNIAAGATGIIVVADRGPQAVADVGVTTVLLAARLAIPAAPASLGDPASIEAAVQRLRDTGAAHLTLSPCVVGPETDPAEFIALSGALDAPCAPPLGAHPAIAQLVAVRYGEALARIAVASH